ncbi:SDR family oxidoreductase [Nocardioides marmoriginsengisoli]|uniref:SDR family oxidoreductase n=1 Tax=Nocardioides marmoriginsengisoli TaxID=661483 RepID=A0A3N0CMY7_9ACTN|nr:SDR family oxidoreductase [Nocardioides marmoriginsengisoli]RNL64818.1 SDR family oxidoreductase [Nocardioides marmoriginsengisoli]
MLRAPVKDLHGKNVFLTGAASGIGRATAIQAAREGAVLFLTDVDQQGLVDVVAEITEAGGEVAYAAPVDISDHDGVRAMADEITAQAGAMDVVMNIAGIASWGTITAMPHSTWKRVVDINLMGPISVLEYLVPPMIEARRGGQIVNVSSAAGIIGMPWHAAYSASKFGLRGVSEVLRFDLARHRIGVSLVCPGGVDTGLTETVNIAGVDNASPQFRKLQGHFKKRAVTPEQAAASILKGVRRNKYWVYTSPDIRFAHFGQRYFPPGYALAMTVMNRVANKALPQVGRAVRDDG